MLIEAIKIDPTLRIAFGNRVTIAFALKQYDDVKEILLKKEDFGSIPEDYMVLGVAYEKLGEEKSARENYEIAISKYDRLISDSKIVKLSDVLNRGVIILMLNDNIENRTKIINQIKELPVNDFALKDFTLEMVKNFDREKILDAF